MRYWILKGVQTNVQILRVLAKGGYLFFLPRGRSSWRKLEEQGSRKQKNKKVGPEQDSKEVEENLSVPST